MKSIFLRALMVVTFISIIPASIYSEIKAGSMEVGVFTGYNFFPNSQNLENAPVFGGRFGYNFTRHFGLEGTLEFMNSSVADKTLTGAVRGQFRSPTDSVEITFYHLDALYYFMPAGKFNPFIVAGIGGASYSPTISTNNMAALNIGIGAKYWVAERIALRFDIRDYMPAETFRWMYPNIGATIGISFSGGGNSVVAKVVEEEKEATPAKVKTEDKVIVLTLEDIHFEYGKADLTKEAKETLKRDFKILEQNPKMNIRIAGYTSAYGTHENNQVLSKIRADVVKDYLVKEGIVKPNRLTTIGYGELNPAVHEVAPNNNYSKQAKANMRVLFEIVVK